MKPKQPSRRKLLDLDSITDLMKMPSEASFRVRADKHGRFSGYYSERWPRTLENELRLRNTTNQMKATLARRSSGGLTIRQSKTKRHLTVKGIYKNVERRVIGHSMTAEFTAWTGTAAPSVDEVKEYVWREMRKRIDSLMTAATGGNELAQAFLDQNPELRQAVDAFRFTPQIATPEPVPGTVEPYPSI